MPNDPDTPSEGDTHDAPRLDLDAVDDEAENDEPFRRDVNPDDRFSVAGKPLPLAEFVRSTMGDLADREHVDPEPQPEPQPFPAVWRARVPAPNPAEADWVPPEDVVDPAVND